MNKTPGSSIYNMSFTAASLVLQETVAVADVYLQCGSWEKARDKVLTDNILKARTASSAKRLFREISLRLKNLSHESLEFLVAVGPDSQKQLLWYSICKTYPFISDFNEEVIQKKISSLDYTLSEDDYDRFFNRKAQWHPELENASISTAKKIKQVIFRILRETGFLTEAGDLVSQIQNSKVLDLIEKDERDSESFASSTRYPKEASA